MKKWSCCLAVHHGEQFQMKTEQWIRPRKETGLNCSNCVEKKVCLCCIPPLQTDGRGEQEVFRERQRGFVYSLEDQDVGEEN